MDGLAYILRDALDKSFDSTRSLNRTVLSKQKHKNLKRKSVLRKGRKMGRNQMIRHLILLPETNQPPCQETTRTTQPTCLWVQMLKKLVPHDPRPSSAGSSQRARRYSDQEDDGSDDLARTRAYNDQDAGLVINEAQWSYMTARLLAPDTVLFQETVREDLFYLAKLREDLSVWILSSGAHRGSQTNISCASA